MKEIDYSVEVGTHIDLRHMNTTPVETSPARCRKAIKAQLRTSLELVGDIDQDYRFTFRTVKHIPVVSI